MYQVLDFLTGYLLWTIAFGVFVGMTVWTLVGLGVLRILVWWREQ